MLVLSRRVNQKLVFPSINTVVQIVSLKSGTVRIGIDAPESLPVYRAEVFDPILYQHTGGSALLTPEETLRKLLHQINNRLNSSTIGVALLHRQLNLGLNKEAASTLDKVDQELTALRQTVESLAPPPPTTPPKPPNCRALVVEDDVNECELLAGFLRLAGLQVDTAGDGADAIDHLVTHGRPDVVLLDMMLPRVDGPATVRAIRGNPAHAGLKIFGVTGADPRCLGLPEGPGGIDRWFRKPLNPEILLRELDVSARRS